MYKGKLQEMCQKGGWGLPKYSCMKDGPDHLPRFKASVSVNGLSFHSSTSCISSKIAHNQAAMHAFLHFSPPPSGSTISSAETNAGLTNIEESHEGSDVQTLQDVKDDTLLMYKTQLQNYTRKKNCDLPSYSTVSSGPPHAPCFKSTVLIDGQTFESSGAFKTLKEAEHSAAKVALMSLSENGIQEDGSGFYKNLLQQIAQREDLSMPIYKTIDSGAPHMPIFIASVEIEAEIFYGKAGKSQKEGEMQAAKAAYLALKERAMSRSSELACSIPLEDGTHEHTSGSDSNEAVNMQQNLNHNGGLLSSPSVTSQKHSAESKDEVDELNPVATMLDSLKIDNDVVVVLKDKEEGNKDTPSCSELVSAICGKRKTYSVAEHPDISAFSTANSNARKVTAPRSYLLSNRFRLYPQYPGIDFPNGIIAMPISDNQWMPFSLELPKTQGC